MKIWERINAKWIGASPSEFAGNISGPRPRNLCHCGDLSRNPNGEDFWNNFSGEKWEVYCKSKLSYAFFYGLNAILECFEQVYGEVVHCKLNLNLVVYRMSSEHEQTEIAF